MTTAMAALSAKGSVLRQYEVYGYRVAYYLLGNEVLATAASEGALAELYRTDDFFRQAAGEQLRIVKRVFMKHSLLQKKSNRGK